MMTGLKRINTLEMQFTHCKEIHWVKKTQALTRYKTQDIEQTKLNQENNPVAVAFNKPIQSFHLDMLPVCLPMSGYQLVLDNSPPEIARVGSALCPVTKKL